MSTTIDERVVEMRFDNKQFESNVATSMSTLEKLKKSLNLTGASKGLEDVGAATKRVDMTGLGGAVDSVKAKFSALQVVGVTALANITNSAINAGKSIVKSLTIDPVKTGFNEYETKMGSIQTILANTEHQGTTLNDVTAALDRLNLYADKTIYNFQEMTRNIGTFTAAGIDLETSVRSIQGIANLAAISGSTSQQASTAMYQLSQALATGTVKLQDWNSVVNAGMGGKVFQNALIQTAAVLDGAGDDVAAWQAKNIDAFGSFRESLSRGAWLTSEVLTRTLEQFTMAAEEGSETWEEYKKSLMDTGYTEAQAESILKMANTASDAATKVKTFTQLMDTLKESAQSGWAQSWEIIIGDFEKAKAVFTELSDLLGGVIGKSADRRNSFLSEVFTSNWDKLISRINEAGVETEQFEESLRKVAGDDKLDSLIEKYGSLEDVFRSGALDAKYLKEALEELGEAGKEAGEAGKEAGEKIKKGLSVDLTNFFKKDHAITLSYNSPDAESVKKIQTALTELGFELPVNGIFKAETRKAVIDFQKSVGLAGTGAVDQATIDALIKAGESLERVSEASEHIGEASETAKVNIDDLVDGIGKLSGRELLFNTIRNSLEAIIKVIGTFRDGWSEIFTTDRMASGLYNALDALHSFSEKLILSDENADKLKKTFKGVASVFDIVFQAFKAVASGIGKLLENFKGLGSGVLDITASIGDYLTGLRDSAVQTNIFGTIVNKIVGVLSTVISAIKNCLSAGKEFGKSLAESFDSPEFSSVVGFFTGLWNIITDIGSAVARIFGNIGGMIAEVLGKGDIFEVLNTGLIAGILVGIKKFTSSLTDAFDGVGGFLENVTGILDSIRGCLEAYQNDLNANALLKIAGAVAILAGSLYLMSTIDEEALGPSIAAIGSLFAMLVGAMALMNNIATPGAKKLDKITNSLTGMTRMLSMIGLASAVLILAGAMKILSGIDTEGILRSLSGLIGIVVILAYATKAMDSESSKITKFAGQMILMAAAVGAMSLVAKYLSSMSWEELAKGGAGLLGIVTMLVLAAKIMDSESSKITKFAGQMILMAAAVGVIALVAKLFASMSWEELAKGGAGILGATIILISAAKIMNKGSSAITKFAGQMMLMSVAVGALALVAKLFATMSWEELAKGGAGVLGAVIILVAVAKIMDSKFTSITKFAGQMILMSIAVGILSASMKLISTIGWDGIAKGLVAIAGAFVILGLAGYILAPIAPAILMLAGAFTLLGVGMLGIGAGLTLISAGIAALGVSLAAGATSIVAAITVIVSGILELVPTIARIIGEGIVELAKVIGEYAPQLATSGLQLILSVLQTLAANAPQITDALFELLIGVINSLSGHAPALVEALVNLMSSVFKGLVDALKTIGVEKIQDGIDSALGLSALMVAMAAALKVAGGIRIGSALKGILVLTAMAVPLLAFVGVLALADGIDNAMTNALALSALIATCSLMLLPLTLIGNFIGSALLGVVALLAMAVPMLAFIGVLALMNKVKNAETNAKALTSLMEVIGNLLVKISLLSGLAVVGVAALAGLVGVIAAVALLAVGIGALMDTFPSIKRFLNTGLPVLEQLAGSIGTMIANFTTAFVGGVGSSLVKMGEDISTFMAEIAKASENAAGIDGSAFNGVKDLLLTLVEIGGTSVLTSITDLFTVFTTGQTSLDKFGSDGVAFFKAMKKIGDAASEVNINEESFDSIIAMAGKLVELQSSIEPIGGVIDFFNGRSDLGAFGENAASFISSMQTAMGALSGVTFNEEAMGQIISAATGLTKLQSSIEPIGGVIDFFNGRSDLGAFGENAASFISSMQTAMGALSGVTFNEEAMGQIISAATGLTKLQSSIEPIGGVIDFFNGRSDLDAFGENAASFISSMQTAMGALSGVTFNEEAMGQIISAATGLTKLQSSIGPIGGVIDFFNGRDDLDTFGANAASFISSMQEAMGALSGVTFNEEAMGQIISAATGLSDLQSSLEPMGGVIDWFRGRSDLETFGTKIGEFATAMGNLKTNLGEDGIPESVVASVTNAGNAINALQNALPTTSWFDGKMDLSTFSGYVDKFGTAISGFSSNAVNIDTYAINSAINAAYRIKTLAAAVSDLDTSGLSKLTGSLPSNGAIVNIGQAMSKFSNEVSDIDVSAVATSVTAATRLKALINTLADLDTSGIENFKPVDIGDALKSYSNTVASLNIAAIDKSIAAANKIKAFISSLSSFKTGGIDSFKSAVDNLSTVNLSGVSDMMTEYSTTMQTSGVTLANSLNSGLQSGLGAIKSTINSIVSKAISSARSRASDFRAAGSTLSSNLASGISLGRGTAVSSASSIASSAANSARGKYTSFYAAGAYLVHGFCNGISENTFRAEAKAAAMAKAAYEAARKELDVNSPSKVFKRLGTRVPEGFAIGLSMLGNEVESSASDMASVAINTTRDAMSTVLNTLNTDIDNQPTIRPIMDLSDVKTGADAIRGMFNGVQTIGVRSNLNAINASINRTLQNGSNDDIISAINKLNDNLGNVRGDTYTVGNVTYDDGSNVSDAIKTIVRYARIGGRV